MALDFGAMQVDEVVGGERGVRRRHDATGTDGSNLVARSAADGGDPRVQEIVQLLSRLLLSHDLQIRGMISIIMKNREVQTSSEYVKAAEGSNVEFEKLQKSVRANGGNGETVLDQVGLMHTRRFVAITRTLYAEVAEMVGKMLDGAEKETAEAELKFLTEYAAKIKGMTVRQATEKINAGCPYLLLSKAKRSNIKKLQWSTTSGSDEERIMELVDKAVIKAGGKKLLGTAPPGDLHRRIQEWLNSVSPPRA